MSIIDNLNKLHVEKKLNSPLILWGIGPNTDSIIKWLINNDYMIDCILDNFKYTFYCEYVVDGICIPVRKPNKDINGLDIATVLLAVNFSDAIRKQLEAYGAKSIYNLQNLDTEEIKPTPDVAYNFIDRSKGKKVLCYILAGYDKYVSDIVLDRIKRFESEDIDYCIASSGQYFEKLDSLAQKNNWSYLYTNKNQVCYIQNLIIENHPSAEYIFKFDEDIFIGEHFFEDMLTGYKEAAINGEYRIGFAVPIVPLNCCGYVSYIKEMNLLEQFEEQFGKSYRSRFSSVFSLTDVAKYLWNTMKYFDDVCALFGAKEGYRTYNCYYNIGCILYTRERWLMMGKWPVSVDGNGMGDDERWIYKDNCEKDFIIYEFRNVLAGHFAFGPQKEEMQKYFKEELVEYIN